MQAHSDKQNIPVQKIGGVLVGVATPDAAVNFVLRASIEGWKRGLHVHLINAYSIALANDDERIAAIYNSPSGICFPDGKPLSWVSRLYRHKPELQQVRGPALFEAAFSASQGVDVRHYLVGGRPEVLTQLVSAFRSKYPGAEIVGYESPPFRPQTREESNQQAARIRESGATTVWVGLGTPKQDFEAARIAEATSTVSVAVGAGFDFSAGALSEAPKWMQHLGFEWLFRLISEPRRLWRRYLFGNMKFIWAAFRPRKWDQVGE